MLKRSEPIFAVRDIHETLAFYRNVLGFESDWTWGTPIGFGGARWGEVHVMFCLQPELAGRVDGHMHFFQCEDIESLHARHVAAGANIISPIENKPWNVREYTVRDPNGYHLRFSGPLKYERPATATDSLPPYIQIVPRRPTWEEYCAVQTSVGWGKSQQMYDTAGRSDMYFVAIDTRNQQVIGTTRVMCDADKWYSIWDVAVCVEYQGQRIGTALIEAAIEQIKRVAPGSLVHLFTYRPEFYQTLGFKTETVCLRKL